METQISPTTVQNLSPRWQFTGLGNFEATPTTYRNAVFAADNGGGLYSLNAATGAVNWQHKLSDYTGNPGSVAHGSPAVATACNLIIVADRASASVLGIDLATGALVWSTSVDPTRNVEMTGSPLVYDGTVYVGTSSGQEYAASTIPGYQLDFRGSVTALDAATGAIKWQTYTVPAGFTGGAVWGSPALDPASKLLFVSTGNNYSVPALVAVCQSIAATPALAASCLRSTRDYIDSIIAIHAATGAIKWARRLIDDDTYTLSCTNPGPATPCPTPAGKDYDFGSGVQLFAATINGQPASLVGSGQKSGTFYALDPATGKTIWATRTAPGGPTGGILWGSATDSTRVYVAQTDSRNLPYKINGATVRGGSWAGLDAATGKTLWQVATPGTASGTPGVAPAAEGPVSVADGVMFAGTTNGTMVALDAATGATLWSFNADGGIVSGPAIANGSMYWGAGAVPGSASTTLYAFDLAGAPGREPLHTMHLPAEPNLKRPHPHR